MRGNIEIAEHLELAGQHFAARHARQRHPAALTVMRWASMFSVTGRFR